MLAVAVDDERLTWPEQELVRQLGDKLYGKRAEAAMTEWTRDMVEERIDEAADVLRQLPPVRLRATSAPGRTSCAAGERSARTGSRCGTPAEAAAISRMEEAITWNRFLERDEAHLMWARAEGMPWKELCYRFGISRPTAHRRWEYALSVIAWRLNGRQVHHRRGRRFVVARAG